MKLIIINFRDLLIVINLSIQSGTGGGSPMRREEHMVGDTFSYRFPGDNADHVLLVEHGVASGTMSNAARRVTR